MQIIDTAEMYAGGGSEELVGEAITGRREEVFLVSKVYPHNGTRKGVLAACERNLRRFKNGPSGPIFLNSRRQRTGKPLRDYIGLSRA